MIGRRGFLQCIGVAVLGLSIALKAPEQKADYFDCVRDEETGISIRFVRGWDAVASKQVNRIDVMFAQPYGFERISG